DNLWFRPQLPSESQSSHSRFERSRRLFQTYKSCLPSMFVEPLSPGAQGFH
ncbi:hypothetical protein PENNAL_c0655G03174, partial [Penicillium nalgiovense]